MTDTRTQEAKMLDKLTAEMGEWVPTNAFYKLGMLDHRTVKARLVKKGYKIETKYEDIKDPKTGKFIQRHASYKFSGVRIAPEVKKVSAYVPTIIPVPHGIHLSDHVFYSIVAYCVEK